MNQRLLNVMLLALTLSVPALATPASPPSKPRRVVSLSLCMDELVLALAERQQIAAVSRVATDPRYSVYWQQAQGLTRHGGLAEQIVAVQPDLILASEYEQGKAVQMLRQLGYRVEVFASPQTLAEIPAHVRAVAQLLHAEARAETALAELQADLAVTAAQRGQTLAPLALSLAPNGYMPGQRSIKNELLRLAGYRTVADQLGLPFDSEVKLETLLAQRPARIFLEEQQGNQQALAQQLLQHPALQQAMRQKLTRKQSMQQPSIQQASTQQQLTEQHGEPIMRTVPFPSQYWLCPGLAVGKAGRALAEAH